MRPNDVDPAKNDALSRNAGGVGFPDVAPKADPYARPSPAAESGTASPETSRDEAFGSLRVRVTTARGALPVCGATVFVSPCGGGVCAACATDDSGLSRLFRLPTESLGGANLGEAPPCARYDVEVLAEGFEPAAFVSVPIYEGVTSVQCAELIPSAAGGAGNG